MNSVSLIWKWYKTGLYTTQLLNRVTNSKFNNITATKLTNYMAN